MDDLSSTASNRLLHSQVAFAETIRRYVASLKACASSRDIQTGRKIHASLIGTGILENSTILPNTLIHMYAACKSMADARAVFQAMLFRDNVSWNALLFGYGSSGQATIALELFQYMTSPQTRCRSCPAPDSRTFVAAIKACASCAKQDLSKRSNLRWLEAGMTLHSQAIASGFDEDVFVASTLVDMYAKCGSPDDALQVFNRMRCRSVVSWNAVLFGFADSGQFETVLELFTGMLQDDRCTPNALTYVAVLKSCAQAGGDRGEKGGGVEKGGRCLEKGMAIHSQLSKAGLDRDLMVASSLIDMYASSGALADARRVFDRVKNQHRDAVLWNSIIFAHADRGEPELALELFSGMAATKIERPNALTFVAALKACSCLSLLETGKRIHSQVCAAGFESDDTVMTALVDFYAKCGRTDLAHEVFESASSKHPSMWNALLTGYTKQGSVSQALDLFQAMIRERLELDRFTFLSVLELCCHTGMVSQGRKALDAMSKYSVVPEIQHYSCVVDLLCRADRVEEALEVVKGMRVEADAALWRTILSASNRRKNTKVGRVAFESALRVDDKLSSTYVLMSNGYEGSYL